MFARIRTLVRLRSGSHLLALFGLTILLPGVLLTVLGARALVQERRFAQQQIRERLERTAQTAVHDLERDLHEWQAILDRIGADRVDDVALFPRKSSPERVDLGRSVPGSVPAAAGTPTTARDAVKHSCPGYLRLKAAVFHAVAC